LPDLAEMAERLLLVGITGDGKVYQLPDLNLTVLRQNSESLCVGLVIVGNCLK